MPHSTEVFQYNYVPETKEDLDWAERELSFCADINYI